MCCKTLEIIAMKNRIAPHTNNRCVVVVNKIRKEADCVCIDHCKINQPAPTMNVDSHAAMDKERNPLYSPLKKKPARLAIRMSIVPK